MLGAIVNLKILFIQKGLSVTSGRVVSRKDLLKLELDKENMEVIIEKTNKMLPFGLKVQNLLPFFITAKLVGLAGFAIFMMNR